MADKKDKKEAPTATSAPVEKVPGIQIVSQYVKDCSFENPNAPESLINHWPASDINVQVWLNQKHIKDNLFESALNFRIEAKSAKDGKMVFIIDIHYGALVALQNIPQENVSPVLMIEVPKQLFPFVRETVAGMVSKGGYQPLYLTPINFEAMYISQIKRLQEQKGKQGGAA